MKYHQTSKTISKRDNLYYPWILLKLQFKMNQRRESLLVVNIKKTIFNMILYVILFDRNQEAFGYIVF